MKDLLSLIDPLRCALFVGCVVGLWMTTGALKENQLLHESDSRKINHVAVFVGGALTFCWLPETMARVNLYTVATLILLLVFITCYQQKSKPFSYIYAANSRVSDAPNTMFFFWFSWVVSVAALAIIDLLFTNMAVTRMAILIVGVADGVAEPIGRRFGQHRYPVFSFGASFGSGATARAATARSIEGSLAVWIATFVIMLGFSTHSGSTVHRGLAAAFTASLVTMVEAISPRGCDNFTLLLTAAGLTNLFLLTHWII